MPAISFDTLAYAKEVEEAGFTRQQAEAFASAQKRLFHEVMSTSELATKFDLNNVHTGLKTEIQEVRAEKLRTELKADIQDVRLEIRKMCTDLTEKMEAGKHEILKWMMGTVVAQTALIVAIIGVAIALVVK